MQKRFIFSTILWLLIKYLNRKLMSIPFLWTFYYHYIQSNIYTISYRRYSFENRILSIILNYCYYFYESLLFLKMLSDALKKYFINTFFVKL